MRFLAYPIPFCTGIIDCKFQPDFFMTGRQLRHISFLLKWMISLRCNVLQTVEQETLLSTKLFNCFKETDEFEASRTILRSSLSVIFRFRPDFLLVPYVFGECTKF